MRRIALSVLSLVFVLGVGTPALGTEVTTYTYFTELLQIDAFDDDGTEYEMNAATWSDSPERSYLCLYVYTNTNDGWFTESGCVHFIDLIASGRLTLTLPPTEVTLDSGRTVTVSASGTHPDLYVTDRILDNYIDEDGCTVKSTHVKRDSEEVAGTTGTLAVDRLSPERVYARVGTVHHTIRTRC